MPEPEPALAAQVAEHLDGCGACRIESDSLREVDRRLVRLGEARRTAAAGLLGSKPGREPEAPPPPAARAPTVAAGGPPLEKELAAAPLAGQAQLQIQLEDRPLPWLPLSLSMTIRSLMPLLVIAATLLGLLWMMSRLRH